MHIDNEAVTQSENIFIALEALPLVTVPFHHDLMKALLHHFQHLYLNHRIKLSKEKRPLQKHMENNNKKQKVMIFFIILPI